MDVHAPTTQEDIAQNTELLQQIGVKAILKGNRLHISHAPYAAPIVAFPKLRDFLTKRGALFTEEPQSTPGKMILIFPNE